MKRTKKGSSRRAGVIPLHDLTPKRNPRGGAGGPTKMVFGERPIVEGADEKKAGDEHVNGATPRREKEERK